MIEAELTTMYFHPSLKSFTVHSTHGRYGYLVLILLS